MRTDILRNELFAALASLYMAAERLEGLARNYPKQTELIISQVADAWENCFHVSLDEWVADLSDLVEQVRDCEVTE
jgi:hypothetical protein